MVLLPKLTANENQQLLKSNVFPKMYILESNSKLFKQLQLSTFP